MSIKGNITLGPGTSITSLAREEFLPSLKELRVKALFVA
jgi:hypothetical protein